MEIDGLFDQRLDLRERQLPTGRMLAERLGERSRGASALVDIGQGLGSAVSLAYAMERVPAVDEMLLEADGREAEDDLAKRGRGVARERSVISGWGCHSEGSW